MSSEDQTQVLKLTCQLLYQLNYLPNFKRIFLRQFHFVAQDGLELINSPFPAFQLLGLQV